MEVTSKACQVVVETLPKEYRCFCRKLLNPEWNRNEGLVPHTCGEVCGRPLATTRIGTLLQIHVRLGRDRGSYGT